MMGIFKTDNILMRRSIWIKTSYWIWSMIQNRVNCFQSVIMLNLNIWRINIPQWQV